jgi:hypothetical protein
MKRIAFVVLVMVLWFASCSAPEPTLAPEATSVPADSVDSGMPVPPMGSEPAPAVTEMVVVPEGKIPAPSFESQTYINETVGFALDYPAGWTVTESVVGERGSQTLILSKPEIADLPLLPEGATRVSVTVYQWDPKNDLAAFVEVRKTAWDSSGFTIIEEKDIVLDLGLPAEQFVIQTPESTALFLFAAVGDQYISISGEGDMELVKEISMRLRPVSVK